MNVGPNSDWSEDARKIPGRVAAWRSSVLLPPLLFAQPLARERLFRSAFLARLHVITMFLDFLDDVFLLHLALETAQCIFQRFTFLNADFSHLDFTVLPMHVAIMAIDHSYYERSTRIKNSLLAITSSGAANRSQALFLRAALK